ncbi:MAG: S-layer homology domain-containing protein, partial [Acidobacteria bacterium]|nr:S-layer homology domain-containing protein [Acidobacteriota bacterium]
NWVTTQAFPVTGVDDAIVDGPQTFDITHVATSDDPAYSDIGVASVLNTTTDFGDAVGVTVTGSPTSVSESGTTDTYSVVLDSEPTASVTVTATSTDTDEATVTVSRTFTTLNWETPQNFTVTGVDDSVAEGDHSVTISHTVISGDPEYNGIAVLSVTVNITDNDTLSVTVAGPEVGGENLASTFVATLNGPVASPTYAWVAVSPTGFPVAAGTASTFSFTPTGGGNYFVSVIVTDAGETSPVIGVIFRVLGDLNGSIFASDIVWLANEGITKGCNPPANDQFCPTDQVTREQMAAFLVRALGLTDDGGGNKFTDDDGSIFELDIAKLAAAGITKGCNPPTNNQFCPNDKVTRAQMAAFLVRALGLTDDGGGNKFNDDDGSIFELDIAKLAAAGITKGCNPPTNDQFCPDNIVTREQMAAFLRRALDK